MLGIGVVGGCGLLVPAVGGVQVGRVKPVLQQHPKVVLGLGVASAGGLRPPGSASRARPLRRISSEPSDLRLLPDVTLGNAIGRALAGCAG